MKNRGYLWSLVTVVLLINFGSAFSGVGSGTGAQPYEITNCTQLQEINLDLSAHYILTQNINCSEIDFEPIGHRAGFNYFEFLGSLDGKDNTISDLTINKPEDSFIGLFAFLEFGGQIKNIGLINFNLSGNGRVGGLVGYAKGPITNSHSVGNIKGYSAIGGLVGTSEGTIENSYTLVNVSGSWSTGGIVGHILGAITNSYSIGTVNGSNFAGGLVGELDVGSSIINSYAKVNVSGLNRVGGLVGGSFYSTVAYSYAAGNVSGSTNVGGLIGSDDSDGSSFINSFYDSEISEKSDTGKGEPKTTAEMKNILTFLTAEWNIGAVLIDEKNEDYIWNIINGETYPFFNWEIADSLDEIYPLFDNYLDNNGSLTLSGRGIFNITILNTNGTVLFEIDNTNISATNIEGDIYNASYEFTINGTYGYKWWSYGNGLHNNINNSLTREYVVLADNILPDLTIISPTNRTYTSNIQLLNISATDNTFIDKIWYNWNGTNYTYTEGTFIEFEEELNSLNVWANDSTNNINSTKVSFTIDTIPPYLEIISPENKTYNHKNILLNLTNSSDISEIWYNWNGTNYTYTGPIEISFGNLSNTLFVWANDSYGNENKTNVTFYINLTTQNYIEETSQAQSSSNYPTYFPNPSQLDLGYNLNLYKKWTIEFKIDKKSYRLVLEDLAKDNATLKISSNSQTKSLNIGEEWMVDVNLDNNYDLLIKLENVSSFRANITIRTINQTIMSTQEKIKNISNEVILEDSSSESTQNNTFKIFLLIVLIIVFGIAGIFRFIKYPKRKIKKH
jgi:hypothetical protein